jgi:hypothetical protein
MGAKLLGRDSVVCFERIEMRIFGLTVAIAVGTCTVFLLLKSIPDMVRYTKLTRM